MKLSVVRGGTAAKPATAAQGARPAPAGGKPADRRCGLCGKTTGLTRTPCCDNWICDDEDKYVLFSYARNSCFRNHRRFTLCGYHHAEDHPGRWTACARCRDAFVPEMVVAYGTNEYNFEKLPDPPAFAPTHCSSCRAIIDLWRDAYSIMGDRYLCEECMRTRRTGTAGPAAASRRAGNPARPRGAEAVVASLERKLRRKTSILSDDEVAAATGIILGMLDPAVAAGLGAVPGRTPPEDLIRWQSLRTRMEQAREHMGLTIRDVSSRLGIAQYRLRAIESGSRRSFLPEMALRYIEYLDIGPWFKRWCKANRELAARAGLLEPRRGRKARPGPRTR